MNHWMRLALLTVPLFVFKTAIAVAQDVPWARSFTPDATLAVADAPLLNPVPHATEFGAMAAIAPPNPVTLASPGKGISKAARDLMPLDRPAATITAQAEPSTPSQSLITRSLLPLVTRLLVMPIRKLPLSPHQLEAGASLARPQA